MRSQLDGRAARFERAACEFDSHRALHDDVAKWECRRLQTGYECVRFAPSSPTWRGSLNGKASVLKTDERRQSHAGSNPRPLRQPAHGALWHGHPVVCRNEAGSTPVVCATLTRSATLVRPPSFHVGKRGSSPRRVTRSCSSVVQRALDKREIGGSIPSGSTNLRGSPSGKAPVLHTGIVRSNRTLRTIRGRCIVAMPQSSKLKSRVRFTAPAPNFHHDTL